MSSEIRLNKLTGQWVIYAPRRNKRPQQLESENSETANLTPNHTVADCPFCPGNEAMLPEIILEIDNEQGHGWQTRVVPNKYPMLTPDQDQTRKLNDLHVSMAGYGQHEVIIEHPYHDLDVAQMTTQEIETVIETYHRRYTSLMQVPDNKLAIIFRNHGEEAGTSIRHPHSQLVVTGVVPRHVRWQEDIAQHYFDTYGRALMHDILRHEYQTQERMVQENGSFVSFVPYAAEVPFEMWIVPRDTQADFGSIQDVAKIHLASILQDCLKRLHHVAHNPAYNYVIHTAARYKVDEPHLCWYVQIRPRLVTPAGFEIGSGMLVNPALPEDNAQTLRNISLA